MNLRLLAESMTLRELNELSNYIYDIRRRYAIENVQPLSSDEQELVKRNKHIDAIKLYRDRLQVGLLEAKTAVDVYRDSIHPNQIA